jgi:hypothetical protein
MLFSKTPLVERAHSLLDELDAHVDDFHAGLNDIENRMHERHGAVQARLAELEAEAKSLRAGLGDITRHRG